MNGAHRRTSAVLITATVLLTVTPAGALATTSPTTAPPTTRDPGIHDPGAHGPDIHDPGAHDPGTATATPAEAPPAGSPSEGPPSEGPPPAGPPSGRLQSAVIGTPGTRGLGDSYFPHAGNGGYNVTHYDVKLRYHAPGRNIAATVTVTARARKTLSSFNLDFRGPAISSVRVNGEAAKYRRSGQELTITPAAAPRKGEQFVTVVRYSGVPGPARQPDLGTYGWVPSQDGAVVVAQPDGAPTWIPVNDHPKDKATYRFAITVPRSLQAVANGEQGRTSNGPDGTRTYVWTERSPMASYLATVAIGKFQFLRGKAGRIPVITAVDPRFATQAGRVHDTTISVIKWASEQFGTYPFRAGGGIVDDPDLGYALETQGRPVYGGFAPSDDFIVHEMAHQWFGNSVSVQDWRHIWLNEGFATYAEWLWREQHGQETAAAAFRRNLKEPGNGSTFNPPPGRPGRTQMFANSVYVRGAMCLQALRERVGDKAFFRIIRQWVAAKRHGNATTADFIALSERVSGKQLDKLFRAWLHTSGRPADW